MAKLRSKYGGNKVEKYREFFLYDYHYVITAATGKDWGLGLTSVIVLPVAHIQARAFPTRPFLCKGF